MFHETELESYRHSKFQTRQKKLKPTGDFLQTCLTLELICQLTWSTLYCTDRMLGASCSSARASHVKKDEIYAVSRMSLRASNNENFKLEKVSCILVGICITLIGIEVLIFTKGYF